jgi:hypothetical protein
MKLVLSRLAMARFALAAIVAAVPFIGVGGCGRTACFQYSQQAYAKNGNACPARMDALVNLADPDCPGPVTSVDGAGSFDGELCCYPVTYDDIAPDCTQDQGQGGSFGSEGFTSTGFSESATGVGGSPPDAGPCLSCAEAITVGGQPCGGVALKAWLSLRSCAGCLAAGQVCAAECANFCEESVIDAPCNACLQGTCDMALIECADN